MQRIGSPGVQAIDVLVIGHDGSAICRFAEALAELDRPFALRPVATLAELESILAADEQFIVVTNDQTKGLALEAVIACCGGANKEAPLIVVSGGVSTNVDEGYAHALFKAGVSGYVYIDRLYRLFWSVQRELIRLDKKRAIRRVERRLAGILDIAPDAVIAADSNRRILVFNRSAETIFGYAAEEVLGRPLEILMPLRFAKTHGAKVAAFAASNAHAREMGQRGEIVAVRKNGAEFPAEASISILREDDGPVFVAIVRDATEKKLALEKMAYLATHDSLTGLPNRALLNDRLQHALSSVERENRVVALMFIDLDGFKKVNDSLGHAAGDELLRAIAMRFVTCTRKSDTVARLGGDEFAVLFEGVDGTNSIAEIAQKILELVREPVRVGDEYARVSASIGITFAAVDGKSAKDVMIEADMAMYQAKAAGKNGFVFHSEANALQAVARTERDRLSDNRYAVLGEQG